jgi:hypothetical protein
MQYPVTNYHLQQRLLPEQRPSSREEWRLFSNSSCSSTLLLARSTWLFGGLLFAPSPGHGFLSGRYRKSGIWNTSRERWIFLILCFDWELGKVQRTVAAMLDLKNHSCIGGRRCRRSIRLKRISGSHMWWKAHTNCSLPCNGWQRSYNRCVVDWLSHVLVIFLHSFVVKGSTTDHRSGQQLAIYMHVIPLG